MAQVVHNQRLLVRLIQKSSVKPASSWFFTLDYFKLKNFQEVARAFLTQYQYNLDNLPRQEMLVALR